MYINYYIILGGYLHDYLPSLYGLLQYDDFDYYIELAKQKADVGRLNNSTAIA